MQWKVSHSIIRHHWQMFAETKYIPHTPIEISKKKKIARFRDMLVKSTLWRNIKHSVFCKNSLYPTNVEFLFYLISDEGNVKAVAPMCHRHFYKSPRRLGIEYL